MLRLPFEDHPNLVNERMVNLPQPQLLSTKPQTSVSPPQELETSPSQKEDQRMAATWEQDFLVHQVRVKDPSVFKVEKEEKEDSPGTITIFYTINVSEVDYAELNKMSFRNALQVVLGRAAEVDYPNSKPQVVVELKQKPIPVS